jgi:FixJ family two-component response regulator
MEPKGRYVAVVDDDRSIGRALVRLLRTVGLEAVAFACGEEFLRTVPLHRPDCVVMDIHLPGLDGFQVRDRLRSMGCATPIVFITALDNGVMGRRAMDGGAVAFLEKPLNENAFLTAVGSATERCDSEARASKRSE